MSRSEPAVGRISSAAEVFELNLKIEMDGISLEPTETLMIRSKIFVTVVIYGLPQIWSVS